MAATNPLTDFHWEPQPTAQKLLDDMVARFLSACPAAQRFAERLREETGTRFFDWIDHIAATPSDTLRQKLRDTGFEPDESAPSVEAWRHPGAVFPRVVLAEGPDMGVALKVESVVDFLAANHLATEVTGPTLGRLRFAHAFQAETGAELRVTERHGWTDFAPPTVDPAQAVRAQQHLETFRTRPRQCDPDASDHAFAEIHRIIDAAVNDLGTDWAADLWFAAERDYWMSRNRAGRVQKARQDALGMGWANHDHHTYRCRRETFHLLIQTLEKLGCFCRERFYAGREAGWGAQVLEHPTTGVVIFADVDLSPEEVQGDFAHEGLAERQDLGTVGLWCELHGESMLDAGLHHLEAQFDFAQLRQQLLADAGIGMMDPFTDWDHLKQQFTTGQRWRVSPQRIDRLLDAGQISPAQAENFRQNGAIGSHLENLERNDGYKGFNQAGISDIIAHTDPRAHLTAT